MNPRKFRCLVLSLIALILCLLLAVLFSYQAKLATNPAAEHTTTTSADEPYTVDSKDSPKLVSDLKRLAVELSETQRSLISSALHYHRVGKHLELVHDIIKSLGAEIPNENKGTPNADSSRDNSAPKKEVCPEKYMGKDHNYGGWFQRKGYDRVNCTEFVPINQLVTMLVVLHEETSPEDQRKVLQGIEKYFPKVTVTFASQEKLSDDMVTKLQLNLKNIVAKDLTHGETWSKLLQEVNTPYVLFAPDITHFTDDVNLERLIRVLSNNKETIIAGGSHKNQRAEWEKDCLQVTFRNWTAYFRGGYYHSFDDCIVCDVLSGPFVAKAEGLKQIGIDEKLPFGVFQDLFWRLKLKHPAKVVVSCPDVMFDTYEREIPDQKYTALAQKWDVKKWVESDGRVRWYGCRRGYSHTSKTPCKRKTGLGVPPCDLENLADAIKFVTKEFENAGIYYEMNAGSALGAVKFSTVLPWELDADIKFLSENYTALQKLRPRFESAGFKFNDERNTECCVDGRKSRGVVLAYRDGWKVELYGYPFLETELLVASGQRPTKVMIAGQWVSMARNPGLYARNRYGPNIYRHSEHWSVREAVKCADCDYNPDSFNTCAEPGHWACLDQFPPDGNLPFSDYPLI